MTDEPTEICKSCEKCDMSCRKEQEILPPEAGGPITVTDELGRDVTYE